MAGRHDGLPLHTGADRRRLALEAMHTLENDLLVSHLSARCDTQSEKTNNDGRNFLSGAVESRSILSRIKHFCARTFQLGALKPLTEILCART